MSKIGVIVLSRVVAELSPTLPNPSYLHLAEAWNVLGNRRVHAIPIRVRRVSSLLGVVGVPALLCATMVHRSHDPSPF